MKAQEIKRIAEAAQSWLLLFEIWNQFGPSPDGAVERDMAAAADRLRAAIADLQRGT